jgi:hypothetical protein
MDSDRKSAVSSFYGGRKSSDALNNDFPPPATNYSPPPGQRRPRKDDASSFYNPDRLSRSSADMLGPAGRASTAGYNQESFFHAGREEPLKGGQDENEAWDVYADFNNAGPRYSSAFGQTGTTGQGYRQLQPQPLISKVDETASMSGPVEMVTVPALGPEWKRSEMRDMTKAGRREKRTEGRMQIWKAWNRDQRGICFPWLTRRVFVFILFGLCTAIGIVIAICLPRVPTFAFADTRPITNATGSFANSIPTIFSRAPTNFSFPAFASLEVDTQGNYLPLTFSHLSAQIFDLDTGRQVGTGDLGRKTFPAKSYPIFTLPLNFTYIALNDTDQTWTNWYNSCKNKALYTDGVRPALKFQLVLNMQIAGLIGQKAASTTITNADCPVELPQNSA